ncbi:MAG: insulinase family protein [Desulfamplus sp.]|nr:insulinase family protein [Desulfamplus sp.]
MKLKAGDEILGYKVLRVEDIEDIKSTLYQLEHTATGARHIHLASEDKENTFGVTFRTVPTDSTGVAHILEHTVLCGSEKYDVRDPFFSMLKRSLSTFMNALTASDWTMYPFSTQNEKDFYNLMDVYLDAAFFPKLEELSFKQEGHRLEFEPLNMEFDELKTDISESEEIENLEQLKEQLIYKGVVYNEMKGAMSSPNQILARALMNALYPDTTYSFNSGGEPSDIPTLTHSQLKEFHARYYHPSNAFFYTYGSLPLEKHLEIITTKVLNRFTAINPNSEVVPQPRWKEPKTVTVPYPLSNDENPEKKYQACVAWLTTDIRDSFEMLVLDVLEHILLGNSASPLRKKLIDSGLGSSLSDASGFDADMRDTMFACGLKEIAKDDAVKVEKIIFETLEELCKTGIDPKLLESAIHQIEFHKKEITNTPHPFGIKLLLSFAGTWIHEGDPVAALNFDDDLERLKQETAKKENQTDSPQNGFLERKIREYFLDNPHRVLFILEPDQSMEERENLRVTQELDNILASLKPEQISKVREDSKKLEELQEAKEDVSVLPTLELTDVKPDIEIIKPDMIIESNCLNEEIVKPNSLESLKDSLLSLTCYEKSTSDILYFTSVSGIGTLPDELKPLVPFFCRAFTGAGTALRDYAQMAEIIDLYTGGIGISPYSGTGFHDDDIDDKDKLNQKYGSDNKDKLNQKYGSDQNITFLSLQGKSLNRNIAPMFDIIGELMSQFSFADITRLKNLLLQYRAGMESSIVANGHRYAMSLAARNLSVSSQITEMWQGISQFQFIRALTEQADIADKLSSDLSRIAQQVFVQGNFKPAVAGDKEAIVSSDSNIVKMLKQLSNGYNIDFKQIQDISTYKNQSDADAKKLSSSQYNYPYEGWMTSTSVSFVAQAFKTVRMGHPDAPALSAISRLLRSLYLHREIREKGGAYGGFASYNAEEGIFSFASYRDPNIRRTLEVYRNACDFITSGDYTEEDIKEAILQVCADIDKPETPGPASIKAFYRQILGLTDAKRQTYKESLLSLDKNSIIRAAEKYFTISEDEKGTAVISSREQLEAANQNLKGDQRELELFLINQ